MDHDTWNIDFPNYCKNVNNIPNADGFEITFEHPDLFRLFPSKELVKYIDDTISSYDFQVLAMHSPTKDVNISSYNPRIRETSFKELVKSIELFSCLNIPEIAYFLVHGGQNSFRTPSRFGKRNLPPSISDQIENLKRLYKICEDFGMKFTIENLIYSKWRLSSRIEYLDALFRELPDIKFTFDIDHAVFVSYSYARKMLNRYSNRVNAVHVGMINYFQKFKNLLIPLNPYLIFEPHSIANKNNLFLDLNRNIKIVKNIVENNKNPEITIS